MTYFNLSFDKVVMRYYLMMTIVLAAFYAGLPYLSIIAVPVFLSAIMGIQFNKPAQTKPTKTQVAVYPATGMEAVAKGKLAY